MYGFEGSFLAFEALLAGLVFFLMAPWISMAVPQAKKALYLVAGGGVLIAANAILAVVLYRFAWLAELLQTSSILLFWGGLAATVYLVCMAAKSGSEEVR